MVVFCVIFWNENYVWKVLEVCLGLVFITILRVIEMVSNLFSCVEK